MMVFVGCVQNIDKIPLVNCPVLIIHVSMSCQTFIVFTLLRKNCVWRLCNHANILSRCILYFVTSMTMIRSVSSLFEILG